MKYIIDIPEEVKWIQGIKPAGVGAQDYGVVPVKDLEPYIELDHKTIEDEVWEFAKKVILGRNSGGLSVREIENCFGSDTYSIGVFQKYSYQEAKEKYEAWKKQKEAIHIGDEVKSKETEWGGVVTNVDQNGDLIIMDNSGETGRYYKAKHFKKTGRHFTEIEELLKKMKEESE